MAVSEDKVAELRVKHLEMVSGAVRRMAGYSASAKGYCLTLVTAAFGLAVAAKPHRCYTSTYCRL